uniref:Uncharacterized protein n=1 Tax=Ananas comosus var. bracteatus TaxID=296719 RepID=A0A6V7P200_ANACO|nr:unnamed protein product [Ananas comosus var. bracteatus]
MSGSRTNVLAPETQSLLWSTMKEFRKTRTKVRVIGRVLSFFRFSGGSLTVFRPMARVPRSVVQSLAPKSEKKGIWLTLGLSSGRLVPVQGCACTGTRLMVVPVQPSELVPVQNRRAQQPEPRVWISWTFYRYKGPCTDTRRLISCSLNCRGAFGAKLVGLEPSLGLEWKGSSPPLELRRGFLLVRAFHAGRGQGSRKGYRLGLAGLPRDHSIGGLPLVLSFCERRLICVDIWRVWARYREGPHRSRGVTLFPTPLMANHGHPIRGSPQPDRRLPTTTPAMPTAKVVQ